MLFSQSQIFLRNLEQFVDGDRALEHLICRVGDAPESRMSDKIQLLLDATLGFINIQDNELFKILTIVSVVGIPPTIMVGIWGMNFKNMPLAIIPYLTEGEPRSTKASTGRPRWVGCFNTRIQILVCWR